MSRPKEVSAPGKRPTRNPTSLAAKLEGCPRRHRDKHDPCLLPLPKLSVPDSDRGPEHLTEPANSGEEDSGLGGPGIDLTVAHTPRTHGEG